MDLPGSEYNRLMRSISQWTGTKEELQALYDQIARSYDDGAEMLRRLDAYQSKWRMNLH